MYKDGSVTLQRPDSAFSDGLTTLTGKKRIYKQ